MISKIIKRMSLKKILIALGVVLGICPLISGKDILSPSDLIKNPVAYRYQQITLAGYVEQESSAWNYLLEKPDEYMGLFIYEKKADNRFSEKVVFPYIFVPNHLVSRLQNFHAGEMIFLRGTTFDHEAMMKDSIALVVDEIYNESEMKQALLLSGDEDMANKLSLGSVQTNQRYNVSVNGAEFQGLRVGEKYNINGVELIIRKDE